MNENPYGNNPQNGYPYQQQNNYPNQQQGGYPPYQQQPYPYQTPVSTEPMPNESLYLVLTVIGFFLGIIWGALSVSPYKKMKAAIAANNAAEANANAKKIRMFFIIGLVVNVLIFIGKFAEAM